MAFDEGADGIGGDDGFNFDLGAEGFFEEVEGFSDGGAGFGQGTASDGSADILEHGVAGARQDLGLGHGPTSLTEIARIW